MVSHKCVEEFGYKTFQLPPNAKAPRSARKKRSYENKLCEDDDKMCAIDLLATVAGNLLTSSPMSIDKPVNEIEDNRVASIKEEFPMEEKSVTLGQPNVVVSLDSSSIRTELPVIGKDAGNVRDVDVNYLGRDDDENFSGYICPRVTKISTRTVPRIGDRRIRKILASRHWKGNSRNGYLNNNQRNYYTMKKRSCFDDYRLRTKTVLSRRGASFVSTNSHVRLRIKSFRVPELLVEIPETATVGSLKRMVMEAVSSLLSDGHRVGLMVQGKKVRDDNKTLHQTGISQDNNNHLDSLDFCLEPSSEIPSQLLPIGQHVCEELLPNIDNVLKSEPADSEFFTSATDDKTLVPIAFAELSARPSCLKSRRSEAAHQRRIRRPFSVSEVEALVQAVEKIGTGRWRDVKRCAFEEADYRTYVDLKDKWKTLVHTAKISPHQRRGEPVPQELLNRVLNAHGYWQLQQNVNNNKQQQQEMMSQVEAVMLV